MNQQRWLNLPDLCQQMKMMRTTYISILVFCLALLYIDTLKSRMIQLAEDSRSEEHFIFRRTFRGLLSK